MTKKQDTSGTVKKTSAQKWADAVTISNNSKQGGIELRFNAEPSPELQPKLRAMGFRHSKSQVMWYGENTSQAIEFAGQVEAAISTSPEGPDLFLSPTFDAVKTNLEKKEFSYVMITLKDGQIKNFVVFEPSKPKAEVIANNFARKEFGDQFLVLAAKPRLHVKEARILFDEGRIIFPEGQDIPTHQKNAIKGLIKVQSEPIQEKEESVVQAGDKIPVREILLTTKDENLRPSYNEGKVYSAWSGADLFVKDLIGKYSNVYYKIIWQDDETLEGSVDLEPIDFYAGKENILSTHISKYFANLSKVQPNQLYSKKTIEKAKLILEGYQLRDETSYQLPKHESKTTFTVSNTDEALALDEFNKWLKNHAGYKDFLPGKRTFDLWFKEYYPHFPEASLNKIWNSYQNIAKTFNSGNEAQIYSSNYNKIMKVIPGLLEHIEQGEYQGRSVKDPRYGMIGLNYEYMGRDESGNPLFSLYHYIKKSEDGIADLDMRIRLLPDFQLAEAISYSDHSGLKTIYPEKDGKYYIDLNRKKELNQFLNQWLTSLIKQGHLIDLSRGENSSGHETTPNIEMIETSEFWRLQIPEQESKPTVTVSNTDEALALGEFNKWWQNAPEFKDKLPVKTTFDEWFKEHYPHFPEASLDKIWKSYQSVVKTLNRLKSIESGHRKMQPYSSIYSKLMKVIPDLLKHIQEGKYHGKSAKDPNGGLMDLNYDYIGQDKNNNPIIALSHYFKQNGDMIADPDMQIRILPELEAAEAMTFQDQFGFKDVYREKDGKTYVDLKRKKDLNQFLNQWLTNIIRQGHEIDLSKEESELENETTTHSGVTESPEFERLHTPEQEKQIVEQFLEQGFIRSFSAQEAFDKKLPVIDLAFRYVDAMEYFRDNIENPRKQQIQQLKKELKELKGNSQKRTALNEQVDQLEAAMKFAEKLVYDESLIFQDDLFSIILKKAKEKGFAEAIEEDMSSFRDYVITNVLDNRAIENYHTQPVNEVVDELINEYFNREENSETMKPVTKNTDKAIATDLKHRDTFVPNVLVPAGTEEPFYSQIFQIYDMKEVIKNNFPHLLEINNKNIGTASPVAMFELMQFGHPSEYGIKVDRITLLDEWEKRGKTIFKALGFPTDDIYPYVNLYLGYESVEPLKEMLFDLNKDGNQWWSIAEHSRPVADVKKGLEIIKQRIEKEKREMKTYLNPKTGKPKGEYNQQIKDVEHTIRGLEDSKEVLQHYLDNPPETKEESEEVIIPDALANDNGVYTRKTAGKNFEEIEIPIPKSAQYEASIDIVKTSAGNYTFGFSADKKFGDYNGTGSAPSTAGQVYNTREEALKFALKHHELRLEVLIEAKDSILGNEAKKNKQLTTALDAIKKFAEENGIALDANNSESKPAASNTIIKGLEATYWTKEDEEDESYPFKIIIDGIEFHALSLQERLLEEVKKLPLEKQIEIADQVSEEFKITSLNDYTTDNGSTIRDGGLPMKIQVIHEYLYDHSTTNDFTNPAPKKSILGFLMDLLINKENTLVDKPTAMEAKKQAIPKMKKKSQHDLNKDIESFIDKKDKDGSYYNEEEKNYIRQYTGSGGLIKEGAAGRGVLYEYYTPELVVKKMWEMAYHYGYDGGSILEPSVGTGNFLKFAPKGAIVFGFETNHYSARVAQITYPNAHIHEKAFETLFFAGNVHLKDKFDNPGYSLVIGNPPYGDFTGKYAGMGEKQYTGATEYDQYFMLRGLDLLKKDGLLVFLIPSSFMSNGSKFNKVKEKIAAKADFVDCYRLPSRIFETTDIGTDILVLRKNK